MEIKETIKKLEGVISELEKLNKKLDLFDQKVITIHNDVVRLEKLTKKNLLIN